MCMKYRVVLGLIALLVLVVWFAGPSRNPAKDPGPLPGAVIPPTATQPGVGSQGASAAPASRPADQVRPFPSQDVLWNEPASEPPFARFAAWARRYAQAPTVQAQAELEAEGIALARVRLQALADLIQTNPQRALELAVPTSRRQTLPEAVQAFVEDMVNTRGDYDVVCVLPLPGHERDSAPIVRSARIDGTTYRVYTFGQGLDYVTRKGVPLNGIAVPASAAQAPPVDQIGLRPAKLMALNPSPARVLDPAEAAAFKASQPVEPVCTATGRPWSVDGTPVAVQFGGQIHPFSTLALAEDWAAEQTLAENLDAPQVPPTAESPYTEGRKRFLLMRVDFPDYQVDVFPTNSAVQHMYDMSNFLAEISYYKHIIAPVGQGTDITPVMRMSENAAAYDNAGLSKLYPEARDVAETNFNYDLDKYDFCFVCTGGKPAYGYAGLGYVGGVGYHLANSYFNVRTSAHEFGHNLGLGHANWWDTGGQSTIGPGSNEEYGDPIDTMGGSGGGIRHFSASFKNRLGWIPNGDAITVTASGLYRLHAHDIATAPIGLRALRLNRSSGDPYWIEFRQLWTDYKALMNGINFRWAGGSSELLDMNPGSAGGKYDHSLTIGRTFSDPALNYHITPLRKANTYPESIDVAINIGPFPTNQPPIAIAAASTLTASPGQTISFSASATDPNGDSLAYFWDFGDGDYSTDNRADTTHAFGSAGEYYVEVTVSDLKGGTARDSVLVTVGSPATYAISGRVLDSRGLPVPGMKVWVNSSTYAFTESDGTYTLTRLATGSYTVEAVDPVRDAYYFVHPFFNNPVAVGPDFTTADFIAMTNSLTLYTPIVSRLSSWKYLDDGSDQGAAWQAPAFDDSAWSNGLAILGYGEGNETTVIRYGTNSDNKYITYYFRKSFNVPSPAAYTNLLLEVLRDDGVVVYLNNTEVYRDNMPAGTITYTTLASDAIEPDAYLQQNLTASGLVTGTNVIAVEIHQADPTSSDVNFDLALSGSSVTNAAQFNLVYIANPADHDAFTSPTNVVINAVAQSGAGPVSRVEFYADGEKLGEDAAAPYARLWLNPPNGTHSLKVIATVGSMQITSAPVVVTVSTPLVEPPPVALALITPGSVWKFLAGATAAPANWADSLFNDSYWPSGPAELGFGDGGEATVIPGGTSSARYPTIYFRRAFAVNDPCAITNLSLRLKRDDGAVVYLNGVEIARDNMPPGVPAYSTLATNAADDGANFYAFAIPATALAVGVNVMAVEVHQSSATSSDLSFDFAFDALARTNRPRGLWLTAPAEGATVSLPGSVTLKAEVVAGGLVGISRVEFFADGAKLGESLALPYAFAWAEPPAGLHQMLAVATDTASATITSAPVNITVGPPPLGTALISFGEVWQYLDDGSDQGTNWASRTFDDRTWARGAARLGYGGDGEVTTVNSGPNPSVRYVTTYFRKRFTAPDAAAFASLQLRLVRDDGAVVYLNGREIFRDNLPSGVVAFNSLATNAIGGADEMTPLDATVPVTGLLTGTNVLAVEMHQSSISSSDIGFDLALIGLTPTNTTQGLYISSPADGAQFNAPANVGLAAFAAAVGDSISVVEYFDGTAKIGQSSVNPYGVTWLNAPVGPHTLTAQATLGGGGTLTSAPIHITVGSPPPPIQPVFTTLLPAGSDWKYWDNVSPVSAGWQDLAFNDALWPSGLARFGWGFDGEITPLTEGRVTHYFRRWFNVPNPAAFTELVFQLARDDGAVVYLNGAEIFRSNMPGGTVTSATLASASVNTPDETTYFETVLATPGSGLLAGNNLVAVELHQGSTTSSDAGFDLRVLGYGTTEPRVYFAVPIAGATFAGTNTIRIEAIAQARSGAVLTRLELLSDGVRLAESATGLCQYDWSTPPYGTHTLIARATESSGAITESAPTPITVVLQSVTTPFIASNSIWKYLDNGSNQGTNWAQPTVNDNGWASGPARLGYGGDGEETTVSYGPSSTSKYITTYFRRRFGVPPGVVYTTLNFRLLRDDGAVVWLNGREVFRSNMPTTTPVISYTDLATAAVSGTDEDIFFPTSVPVTNLPAGVNLLAVEVHQSAGNSSDLGFDLELVGEGHREVGETTPSLMALYDGGLVEISWPDTAIDWRLYSAPDPTIPANAWTPAPDTPVLINGRVMVTLQPTSESQVYQLRKP